MEEHRPIADEVEGAASIVAPLSVGVLAEVLDADESDIVNAIESLETAGRVESSRLGVTASASTLSPTRLAHIAGKLADTLERQQAQPALIGRARFAAGDARSAHETLISALDDESTTADERAAVLDLAIESGREARVPIRTLASLFVARARDRELRGESDLAIADLEAATPHLEGEALVDAYGFAAAVYDGRQHPADAERTIAMALLVAANEDMPAKLGSLLTFQGRLLARLGFDSETERVFATGTDLVNTHGDTLQRNYAALNQAWTDLDRGWVARAESRYSAARSRGAVDDPVALAVIDIAIARAKWATGDGTGAAELLADVDRVATETEAPVLRFLSTLARAEGAISFRQPSAALEAATALREIVEDSFPAWINRAATVEARALLLAQRRGDAREAIRRGLDTTPRGANGLRLRTELEALALVADERWDEERAADVADRLLQGGWLLAAVALLTERARREKRPELGRAAAALAHRIGAIPAAAEAIEAAGAWEEAAAGPVALAMQRVAQTVPEDWRERWLAEPAVEHALESEGLAEDSSDSDLLVHLDEVLAEVGLAGTEILSPAQRRAAGLVSAGSAVMSMGRFVAWVAAAAIVAAVVAIALRPEPVEVPVAAQTTTSVTTTTIPPLLERRVPTPDGLGGQAAFAGGETRNAVFEAEVGEPTGVYWTRELTGFVRSDPVLRGRNLYVGTSEGWVYGIDIALDGAVVYDSQLQGAIDTAPNIEQAVGFQEGDQSTVMHFVGDDRGNVLVRHVNDTGGEVYTLPFESPLTGPPLVRSESMIFATEDGVIFDLLPRDGSELRRFPEEGSVEGGFEGPLAAADGFIYARTGEGAIIVIEEATLSEICTVTSAAARATTYAVVDGDRWYVGTSARTIRVFGTGTCSDSGVGSLQVDTPVLFAPVVADGVVWATADETLLALDADTGGIGFVVSVGAKFTTPPVIAGDLLLIGTDTGDVVAISVADGQELWRVPIGSPMSTRPIVANDLVLVATARGDLVAIAAPAS